MALNFPDKGNKTFSFVTSSFTVNSSKTRMTFAAVSVKAKVRETVTIVPTRLLSARGLKLKEKQPG